MRAKNKHSGFTLIELMVTVVIVGILAAIAIPNYTNYVTRGKLTFATTGLANLGTQMEQYYQDNRSYANAGGNGCGVNMPAALASDPFAFNCQIGATNQTYVLTANGVAARGTGGFSYTLNQANVRATTGVGTQAWLPLQATCWVINTGGQC